MKTGCQIFLLSSYLVSILSGEATIITVTDETYEIVVIPSLSKVSEVESGVIFRTEEYF